MSSPLTAQSSPLLPPPPSSTIMSSSSESVVQGGTPPVDMEADRGAAPAVGGGRRLRSFSAPSRPIVRSSGIALSTLREDTVPLLEGGSQEIEEESTPV